MEPTKGAQKDWSIVVEEAVFKTNMIYQTVSILVRIKTIFIFPVHEYSLIHLSSDVIQVDQQAN